MDDPTTTLRGRRALALTLVPVLAFAVTTVPGVRTHAGYSLVLDGWLNNLAYAAAAVICLLRVRQARTGRLPGLLLAAGLALYGGGNIAWTVLVRPLDPQPFPSIADALFLAFYPLAFAALVLVRRAGFRSPSLTEWIDGLIGALAVGAVASALLADPLIGTVEGSWSAIATTSAYPLLDLVLLLVILTVLSLFGWRPPTGVWLLTGGLLLFVVADVDYLLATARDDYSPGGLLDGVWILAVVLIALSPGWPDRPKGIRLPTWAMLMVPTASTCAAVVLLVADHFEPLEPPALVLSVATIGLALARMIRTVKEVNSLANSRLLALTDELTGLPNRRALYEWAAARISGTPQGHDVALLLLDLDRFKEINDSLGHQAGDTMLQVVAGRLRVAVDDPDQTVVRLGGDEFAVLMTAPDLDTVEATARRIRDALSRPVKIDGITVWVGASVGIAWQHPADADLGAMLRQADVAMYRAKSSKVGILTYSADEDQFIGNERLETIDQLRAAIDSDGLHVYYQPKIDTKSKRVRGVEALVRWQHPTRGLLGPEKFLSLVEEVGLMGDLTKSVLRQALDQIARWRLQGRDLSVAVNLSASSLIDLELPDVVHALLAERDLPPRCLEIEITEEFLMSDRDRAREILGRLKQLGIRLAIDDYGTGYSSLAYLKELPVDELKLDRSFVRDVADDPRAMAIVASTIGLAHSLGMDLVAEGVEDAETAAHLAGFGCDIEQGWLYSKAVPAHELEQWLDQHPDGLEGLEDDADGDRVTQAVLRDLPRQGADRPAVADRPVTPR